MSSTDLSQLTLVLRRAAAGERKAASELLPLVYDHLRSLARSQMNRLPPGATIQPTALVHEAYLRLVGGYGGDQPKDPGWEGRKHFFGAAARAMRDILVEQARRRSSLKRGGGAKHANIDADALPTPAPDDRPGTAPLEPPDEDMLALDAALKQLEELDPRKAEVVMLKYFAGLENAAIALALNVSTPTVERDWRFARSWLQRELGRAAPPGDPTSGVPHT